MRWSVNRICALGMVVIACSNVVAFHEYFVALLELMVAAWMWAYDNADHERRQLRRNRTVTHEFNIEMHPGESPEVFARRIADEIGRHR